ncbi:transposon Tf2-1 polyprotein [Dorcoceras hygrometricum]|uniref:Transposon Tf2-1 polyprotein n=1 Tax=Dorcoceras hygrometricum TaxID=472368 RepID=A0A2Z7BWA3_9LAMI|nr:transposon Tf2-1 polyprotein [Dorcoceras hygrometricum]
MSKTKIPGYIPNWPLAAPRHPSSYWEEFSMDFITGLPKSKGYDIIMIVVDRLYK